MLSFSGNSTSSSSSSRKTSNSQQPPPLPPPPAPEIMHHFPSPFRHQLGRLMHGGAISDARLYNRSLMGGEGGGGLPPPPSLPPAPPTRGLSSYNGVRTGSFASFGHPTPHFGAPMQVKNKTNIFLNILHIDLFLTVSISLSQQLQVHGKSYFWTKFFLQPPETQKTSN
jgi:hypothetical protein